MASSRKPRFSVILLAVIALVLFFVRQYRSVPTPYHENNSGPSINRSPERLVYSKHARCRMNCRHIDESEVVEILEHGVINAAKSEPSSERDPKYALEGKTHDGQEVRIIYAMAREKTVVITVIDLDQDIECSCP